MENTTKNKLTQYLTPLAIVVAGGIIGAALYFGGNNVKTAEKVAPAPTQEQVSDTTSKVRPVAATDHIKGNPDAPIKIVAYSDFECPFCQRFHNTMNELMKKYVDSGEVAWVFRQFPLEQLHPVKAQAVAVASECASELAGNDGFWKFTDRYFELTLTNNRTDTDVVIPQIAKEMGLNTTEFFACTKSGKYNEHIQADIANATETGGRGTPWSILIAPNGKTFPINGAQPLASIEQLINLAKKETVK
ncbi:MAG: thioredoxin domain-containing protein [Candidatus Pacebacteria bacterium]|nr:thioredoxin domain-containing protein [Candidatus Paceibacterota bacterium]MBP9842835.1 thioredoxin domain-containing protein [Candidatus Paceibacterota bacterium]